MQDKEVSTTWTNCLSYRDLRVDKQLFLWIKSSTKFLGGIDPKLLQM